MPTVPTWIHFIFTTILQGIRTCPSVSTGNWSQDTPEITKSAHAQVRQLFVVSVPSALNTFPPATCMSSTYLSPYLTYFLSETFFGNLNCEALTLKYFLSSLSALLFFFFPSQHLTLTGYFTYLSCLFSISATKIKVLWGQNFLSLLIFQHPGKYLMHSKCSINIYWMNNLYNHFKWLYPIPSSAYTGLYLTITLLMDILFALKQSQQTFSDNAQKVNISALQGFCNNSTLPLLHKISYRQRMVVAGFGLYGARSSLWFLSDSLNVFVYVSFSIFSISRITG